MVKIADKSPGGWKTVKEYLLDSIASDSDNKRKLRTAESRALSKIKTKLQKITSLQ